MSLNVVLAPDNNYAKHAAACMASAVARSGSFFDFWIIDGGLSEENRKKLAEIDGYSNFRVNFVEINPDDFKDYPEAGYITRATWYRLKIASLLPERVDVCLYLDCDVIVNADLAGLFATDLSGVCAAVSMDCWYEKFARKNRKYLPKGYKYFNSGVMLMNLAQWRKCGIEEEIMRFLRETPNAFGLFDQTILNIVLQGKTADFGIKYNLQFTPKIISETCYPKDEYRAAAKSPAIIHYVGEFKPWVAGYNALNPYYKLYLDALSLTAWKMSDSERERFVERSEAEKGRVFRKLFVRQLKRKPWWVFRKYFWNRVFL